MPERRFDDGYWDDPFVQSLAKDGKLLYAYLWTNKHCNQAGLYQITPSTIAFETNLSEADIPQLFEELAPKVVWYRSENLVWVKNFIKRQSISSKFLVAVARCLTSINNHVAVEALIDYNRERYTLLIPYEYPIDRVSIPSTSTSPSNTRSKREVGVVKGKGELSSEEKEIIGCLGQLKGWQADEDDVHWLQGLRSEYPGFTLAESKACVDYHSGKPVPKHKGIWKNRFRNWMIKKREFELKGGKGEQSTTKELKERWKQE
ncbi:hypothetical protein ES708_19031 [subsurface metagenome]